MIKINIGFKGGDVAAARLSDEEVTRLRAALDPGRAGTSSRRQTGAST